MGYGIKINYSARAHKYLKKINRNERNRRMLLIEERINRFIEEGDKRYIHQDSYFSKMGKFNSTVYYLRINPDDRAVISIDEDPIFEQVVVNVFTICNHDSLTKEINGIMESLHQKMLNEEFVDKEDE